MGSYIARWTSRFHRSFRQSRQQVQLRLPLGRLSRVVDTIVRVVDLILITSKGGNCILTSNFLDDG